MVTATLYQISPLMWSLFYLMYEAFERDGYDFFTGLLYYTNIHLCGIKSLAGVVFVNTTD